MMSVIFLNLNAESQTLTTLYNFTGGSDGNTPNQGLIFDASGNLYGTTLVGGEGGHGVVFELSRAGGGSWTETVLHTFGGGTDGSLPFSSVTLDAAGNLYGTTADGGANDEGIVYKLSRGTGGEWSEVILHSFAGGADGANPYENLVFDAAGNLYGITQRGGSENQGVAFQLSPAAGGSWTETVIQSFAQTPIGPLTIDQHGIIYGTTFSGSSDGTVYQLAHAAAGWRMRTLFNFSGCKGGCSPQSGVVLGGNGHLYGVTQKGGFNFGVAFELVPTSSGQWSENVIYEFGSNQDDVHNPMYQLAVGARSFWGVGDFGGLSGCEGIFKLALGSSGWVERTVYRPICSSGNGPVGASVVDAAGHLYGPGRGGAFGAGTVYEFVP